jgi:dihydroorotate dehydrogenase (NAD+) catalytic subunit
MTLRRVGGSRRGANDIVVDPRVFVGPTELPNPVMTASGTSGYGDELARYLPLGELGAVVAKSQGIEPWAGNPPPRVHETAAGMINSVGLQGDGVKTWVTDELSAVADLGARVVASIWGRTVDEYRRAAEALSDAPGSVIALEVNLSCPNLNGHSMFAQSSEDAAAVVAAVTGVVRIPVWAKLTAQVADLVAVAGAVVDGGADALTLINTVPGMVLDLDRRRPRLGAGGGGLSGPAIHPIAVRAVYDVHRALPRVAIVGVGGVANGADAVELMLAGASAVQVGTATFAEPRAAKRVLDELVEWCARHEVRRTRELIGGAHGD